MKKPTKPAAKKTDKQRLTEAKELLSSAAILKSGGIKVSDAQLLKAVEAKIA